MLCCVRSSGGARSAPRRRDELAAFHSITSSARASSSGGNIDADQLGCFEIDHHLELHCLTAADMVSTDYEPRTVSG
jgi:hypothetical protein